MNHHKTNDLNQQILGTKFYDYQNVEIVEVDGEKRVVKKETKEVMPMRKSNRFSRNLV